MTDEHTPTITLWEFAYRQLQRRFFREFGREPTELERAFFRMAFIDGYSVAKTGNWQLREQTLLSPLEAARKRMLDSNPDDAA